MPENRVIDMFRGGAQPNEVKRSVQWSSISVDEREQLFQEAETMLEDPRGYDFLVMLYLLTHPGYPWDIVRVLGLVTRRRSIPVEKRVSTLIEIRRNLDKIRDMLSSQPGRETAQLERYKQYEADYYVLYGNVQIDTGKTEDALKNYELALERYQKLGSKDRVDLLRQKIASLSTIQQDSRSLIPLHVLRDEREVLAQAINELQEQKMKVQADLAGMKNQLRDLEEYQAKTNAQMESDRAKAASQLEAIAKEVHNRQIAAKEAANELLRLQEQRKTQRKTIESQTAAMRFFAVLPRYATAPLWVEVLRLCLQQGQVDLFMLQAIGRLTPDCPPEALPVIAEIAARIQQPELDLLGERSVPIAEGFALMAKIQQQKNLPAEKRAAELLRAWEIILSLKPAAAHA